MHSNQSGGRKKYSNLFKLFDGQRLELDNPMGQPIVSYGLSPIVPVVKYNYVNGSINIWISGIDSHVNAVKCALDDYIKMYGMTGGFLFSPVISSPVSMLSPVGSWSPVNRSSYPHAMIQPPSYGHIETGPIGFVGGPKISRNPFLPLTPVRSFVTPFMAPMVSPSKIQLYDSGTGRLGPEVSLNPFDNIPVTERFSLNGITVDLTGLASDLAKVKDILNASLKGPVSVTVETVKPWTSEVVADLAGKKNVFVVTTDSGIKIKGVRVAVIEKSGDQNKILLFKNKSSGQYCIPESYLSAKAGVSLQETLVQCAKEMVKKQTNELINIDKLNLNKRFGDCNSYVDVKAEDSGEYFERLYIVIMNATLGGIKNSFDNNTTHLRRIYPYALPADYAKHDDVKLVSLRDLTSSSGSSLTIDHTFSVDGIVHTISRDAVLSLSNLLNEKSTLACNLRNPSRVSGGRIPSGPHFGLQVFSAE